MTEATDHDHAGEPIVEAFKEPHWSAIVTFPSGVQVMVCDASEDPDLSETAVVTVFETTADRVLLRSYVRRPEDPAINPAEKDVVGNDRGTVDAPGHGAR